MTISFGVATACVLVLSFVLFHYLHSLNEDLGAITSKQNKASTIIEEIRISAVRILKKQRDIIAQQSAQGRAELALKLKDECIEFSSQLQNLDAIYGVHDPKNIIAKMTAHIDSLSIFLGKSSHFYRDNNEAISTLSAQADQFLDYFITFQDIQSDQSSDQYEIIKKIIQEIKKRMLMTLIIGLMASIILGLIYPGKIALPFKKIKDAIRELQECNFDVSIFYNQDDEIGEIAREMNKMIHGLKSFEALRANRIAVENRKFDVLANMVRKPLLVANAQGKITYMNNRIYSIMQVQSEDIIGKNMVDTVISKSIIECYEMAIKRRSKIDNAEITIYTKSTEANALEILTAQTKSTILLDEEEGKGKQEEVAKDKDKDKEKEKEKPEIAFEGYASVIPIRAKESSLDYYLMVLSTEVFA